MVYLRFPIIGSAHKRHAGERVFLENDYRWKCGRFHVFHTVSNCAFPDSSFGKLNHASTSRAIDTTTAADFPATLPTSID